MSNLRERIAYLQGLAEGLKLGEGDQKDKIIREVISVLADFADELENLQVAVEDLEMYLEDIEEDLEDFEEDEEDFFSEEQVDQQVKYIEVECPRCHDIICFEEDILDDEDVIEVTCPNCNRVVFVNDGSMPLPERKKERSGDSPSDDEEI
jgi:phage FluMu protein Com